MTTTQRDLPGKAATAPERDRLLGYRATEAITCYALILPTIVLLAIFNFYPFILAFYNSFFDYEIGGERSFIGLGNYGEYLQDPTMLPSFANMGLLTLFALVIGISVPLVVAKLIFSLESERWKYLYRLIFLVPIVVPGVAGQLIWQGIYSENGLLNEALRMIGLGALTRGWLSDPQTALYAIMFIGFPWCSGISILIFYAGLAGIPTSVHEAAELDGARGVYKFLRIDVPMVLSQVKLLVVLTIIGGVQGFENIFILTRGGPGFETMVPGLWMYFNAFNFQRMGLACAIGVVLFLIILALTALNLRYFKTTEELTTR
jgi:raffinose/stachyose/melibiose transport system permease protein